MPRVLLSAVIPGCAFRLPNNVLFALIKTLIFFLTRDWTLPCAFSKRATTSIEPLTVKVWVWRERYTSANGNSRVRSAIWNNPLPTTREDMIPAPPKTMAGPESMRLSYWIYWQIRIRRRIIEGVRDVLD